MKRDVQNVHNDHMIQQYNVYSIYILEPLLRKSLLSLHPNNIFTHNWPIEISLIHSSKIHHYYVEGTHIT